MNKYQGEVKGAADAGLSEQVQTCSRDGKMPSFGK